jgi:hypothetical protein
MIETFYFKKVGERMKNGPISAGIKYYRFRFHEGITFSTVDSATINGNYVSQLQNVSKSVLQL